MSFTSIMREMVHDMLTEAATRGQVRTEFTTPVSQFILWGMLVVSLAQAAVTIYLLRG